MHSFPTLVVLTNCQRWSLLAASIVIGLAFLNGTGSAYGEESIQFNRDIRPLLSQACFRCHGFDANTREASLRLDVPDGAFRELEGGGAAIVPGKPDESAVWQRVSSDDEDLVMPPPSSNRQLSEAEKELIQRWIAEGAKYEKHWSFEPIPARSDTIDIDQELEKEMGKQGLTPNPTADAATRLRRLAFTLTGLPPSVQDLERFVKDPSDSNYERFVDQYLASPHYGEEMAKFWLDLARYGDTHGMHLDNVREMWAYRDWVIRAFNRNLPYDQFTIEQLAGDQLPDASQDQWVATGYNRCNVTTGEGGAINEEFLYRYAVDRTSTAVQTWLGLTAGCAVCHDHKYDPLSAKEFYSLYAFFYSAADPAMDGNAANTNPFRKLPTDEQGQRLADRQKREEDALAQLQTIAKDKSKRAPIRAATASKGVTETPTEGPTLQLGSMVWIDDELPFQSTRRNTTRNPEVWIVDDTPPMGKRYLFQSFGNRYEQTITGGWPARIVPDNGKLQFWVKPDRLEPPKAISISVKAGDKTRRWIWANELSQAHLIQAGVKEADGPLPRPGTWTQLTVSLDNLPPQSEVQEIKIGLFGGNCSWDGFVATGNYDVSPRTDFEKWWGKQKGKAAPFASTEVAAAVKDGPDSEAGKKHREDVEAYFHAFVSEDISPELQRLRDDWNQARIDTQIVDHEIPFSLVFTDLASPREAFVMTRGQYDAPGEKVEPGTPAILPELKVVDGKRPTRLDLAKWMVAPENPLVARVAVNRFWQQVFGTGIVKTSDDFGTQGTPPSHPLLLDGLADEFRKSGWNIKKIMKRLVMSRAFQRASRVYPDSLEKDPDNTFLARGPRLRLDAEQIRDHILSVSGLLNPEMGGVGFKTYQPANIWEPVGYGDSNTRYYVQDHGESIYKRTIYAFIKRTAPPPFLVNFDGTNREQICSKRDRSNTPLQALQLMNDMQYLEAARYYAEEIVADAGSEEDAQGIDKLLHRIVLESLGRSPTAKELEMLRNAYQQFRNRLENTPEDASRIANWGEKPRRGNSNDLGVASMALLINLVFNLDEFIHRN